MTSHSPVTSLRPPDFSPNEEGTYGHWKNHARSLFKAKTGNELFEQLEKRQYQDVPTDDVSAFSSLGDRVSLARYELSLGSFHSLSQDGADCNPMPVGASGFAKVIGSPNLPSHSLFQPSRILRLRMRHSNLSFTDDAMLDGRVTCLKFADCDTGGPLDLILHTGRIGQYFNAKSFQDFAKAFKSGADEVKRWCFQQPVNYEGRVENVRRAPDSFYDLRYYSHVTYEMTSTDGGEFLARFRLLPADGRDETGLPTEADQKEVWNVQRCDTEKRKPDYLRRDFNRQLSTSLLQYRLQIQIMGHSATSQDSQECDAAPSRADGEVVMTPREAGSNCDVTNDANCDDVIKGIYVSISDFSSLKGLTNGDNNKDDFTMKTYTENSIQSFKHGNAMTKADFEQLNNQKNSCNEKENEKQLSANGVIKVKASDSELKQISKDQYNPCLPWDTSKHPWQDLAIVTMTTPLSYQALADTQFSLANQHGACKPCASRSPKDFNSLALATKEFHGTGGRISGVDTGAGTMYRITVVTGKLTGAGTDADVFISITGTLCKTRSINLDQRLRDDFEPGKTDVFEEQAPPVGDLVAVDLTLSSMFPNRKWFLDEVLVSDVSNNTPVRFPCYQWLTSQHPRVSLARVEATIPHLEPLPLRYLQRKFELSERRRQYQWERVQGLPGRMKADRYEDLPKEAQFHTEKERDLLAKYVRTLANTGSGKLRMLFGNWNIVEDNSKLLTKFLKDKSRLRHVTRSWDQDEEFGRQMLNGPHPIRIQRVTQLPEVFLPGRCEIEVHLDRPGGLDRQIAEGYLYMLSYPELKDLDKSRDYHGKYRRHLAVPTCLLHVTGSGTLRPIAIALSGDVAAPVWTPSDPAAEWTLAKMWVREADAQIHHVISRHLHTHVVMEAVAMATMRNLPSVHPVYKLLLPHLRYTIAVNVLGRKSLYPADQGLFDKYLAVGGQHDRLLRIAYSRFQLSQLNLPLDLSLRGVDCSEQLPGYCYRDDAMSLWKCIRKFIRTFLYLHYWSDSHVSADEELQAWIQDMGANGLPSDAPTTAAEEEWQSPNHIACNHGVPEFLRTLDEVISLVTLIVFTASAQHAALTSGIVDYYGYVPNAPTMLLAPPPAKKGSFRKADFKKFLPSRGKTAEIIAACYTISRYDKDEVYLGQFPESPFEDEPTRTAIAAFQEDLQQLSAAVRERNAALDQPYTYLIPDTVPNSVSM